MKTARTAFVCLLITACLYQSSWAAGANFSVWAERRTIVHNGLERIYEVRVPTGALRSEARVPLVLVLHGRAICAARKPACAECPVADRCPRMGVS